MAIKYYSIIFRDAGTPKTSLSPTLDVFYNLFNGASLAAPTVSEVAGGIYRFGIDWDIAPYIGIDQIVLQVNSQSGAMADSDKYVYGQIERYGVNDTYTIANSANTSISTVNTTVNTINTSVTTLSNLMDAMVLGDWTIEDSQLKIYKENGTQIKIFDLFDINGDPTSTSATSRVGV